MKLINCNVFLNILMPQVHIKRQITLFTPQERKRNLCFDFLGQNRVVLDNKIGSKISAKMLPFSSFNHLLFAPSHEHQPCSKLFKLGIEE